MKIPHCQLKHERVEMEPLHHLKAFECPVCKTQLTPTVINLSLPEEYRVAEGAHFAFLKLLLDYDIRAVVMEDGKLFIEYPMGGT